MTVLVDTVAWLSGFGGFLAAPVALVLCIVYHFCFAIYYPANLPLAGESDGARWFSWRTRWRYYTDCAALYREAYEKYSKKGRTVLLPGLGFRHDILLPHSAMRWALSHPESDFNHPEATLELVQLRPGLGHGRYKTDPWPGMLVKTEVTAALENIAVDIGDELKYAFDEGFSTVAGSWTEIDLIPTIRKIVARVASRFTVGLPLCRDEAYIADSLKVIDGMVINGGLNGATPRILRPALGPVFSWGLRRNIAKIKEHIKSLYLERSQSSGDKKEGIIKETKTPDFLQMMVDFARQERPNEINDLDVMTRRLVFANFASMHQTGILFTNLILNIIASDAEYQTVSELREELSRVIDPKSRTGSFSKQEVARLVKIDSAARETLRLQSSTNRSVFRKVMKEGIETEDGIRLPKGSYVSFFGHPAQCDPDVYREPFEYDPFRFSRDRAKDTTATNADVSGETAKESTRVTAGNSTGGVSFVSTSPQYLGFGYGLHSCPGRFLVDLETKLMVAYLLKNYDLDFPRSYAGRRPPNVWLAEACLPPPGVKIMVRRREVVI